MLPGPLKSIALACGVIGLVSPAHTQTDKPNVVVILADDLGNADLGYRGSDIRTPNIDKLAQRGVRFRQFYNNGRCCPTRAALMTGRYQHQVGMGAMIDGYAKWQRDAADRDALPLREQIGHVAVVEPGIGGRREIQHPCPDGIVEPMRG